MENAKNMKRFVGLGIVLATMTGSTAFAQAQGPIGRRSEGIPSANRGQSASVVFAGPAVAAAMSRTPDWVRPEFSRNNDNLAYARPRALTAIDQWPQAQRPSIRYERRTTLSQTAQQIIIFTNGRRFQGRGGQYGNSRSYGNRGLYGNNGSYGPRRPHGIGGYNTGPRYTPYGP